MSAWGAGEAEILWRGRGSFFGTTVYPGRAAIDRSKSRPNGRGGVRGQRRKDPNAIGLKATGGQKSLIHWGSNCVRPDCMVEFAPGPGGQVWSECDE
jgi:hypothetical protein